MQEDEVAVEVNLSFTCQKSGATQATASVSFRDSQSGDVLSAMSIEVPIRSINTLRIMQYLAYEGSRFLGGRSPSLSDMDSYEEAMSEIAQDLLRPAKERSQEVYDEVTASIADAYNVFAYLGTVAQRARADSQFEEGLPRFWDLLRFCLGSNNRERIFLPAYNDLLADHLESQLPKYQTTWARRWIQCCFAARTVGLVVQCMAVGLRGATAAVIVPVALREWIRNWWYGG